MATRNHTERLATTQIFREQVRVRHAPISARLAESDRIDRFLALWKDVTPKPEWSYEFTRGEDRRRHPAELERKLLHAGIAAGEITKEAVIAYRAAQLHDDLKAFGGNVEPGEALYVEFMTQAAEAVEAETVAKGMPTPQNISNAIRQLDDVVAVGALRVATLHAKA